MFPCPAPTKEEAQSALVLPLPQPLPYSQPRCRDGKMSQQRTLGTSGSRDSTGPLEVTRCLQAEPAFFRLQLQTLQEKLGSAEVLFSDSPTPLPFHTHHSLLALTPPSFLSVPGSKTMNSFSFHQPPPPPTAPQPFPLSSAL